MNESAPRRRVVAVLAALAVERRLLRPTDSVRVWQSGPGPAASRAAAERAIAAGAGALVSWGLAGGLRPGLTTGAVIISARVEDASGAVLNGDPAWAEHVRSQLIASSAAVQLGGLLSSDNVLTSAPAKAAAAAGSDAVAVDMETFAIAAVAAAHGVPWIALRVIADEVLDGLPAGIQDCVDGAGNMRFAGVTGVLLRPGQWAALMGTAACYRRARRSLKSIASVLVGTDFAAPPAGPIN